MNNFLNKILKKIKIKNEKLNHNFLKNKLNYGTDDRKFTNHINHK